MSAAHYKPATWGRVGAGTPPSRGGVAAFGPAGSALWGGATTPTRLPRAAQPRGASAVGGRSAQSAALFRGQGVPPLRGPASSAGRPRRCAALSPVCCPLAPVSPPAQRVPPLWRWAALRPWDGGARPSPAPALCCARPGSPPGAWFFSPPPRGFVVPGALFPSSRSQFRPAGGARGPKMQKMVQKWAKTGEKRRK